MFEVTPKGVIITTFQIIQQMVFTMLWYFNQPGSITLNQAFYIHVIIFQPSVNNIKSNIFDGGQFEKNQNGLWKLDLSHYLHGNIPTAFLNFDNMGQDTTFVLLDQPQSSIFDISSIFIGGHFRKNNQKVHWKQK